MSGASEDSLRAQYVTGGRGIGNVLSLAGAHLPDIGAVFSRGKNLSIVTTAAGNRETLERFVSGLREAMPHFSGELRLRLSETGDVSDADLAALAAMLPEAQVAVMRGSGETASPAEKNHLLLECAGPWMFFVHPCAVLSQELLLHILTDLSNTGAHFCVLPVRDDPDGGERWMRAVVDTNADGELLLRAMRVTRQDEDHSTVQDLAVPEDVGFFVRKSTLLSVNGFSLADTGSSVCLDLTARIFNAGLKMTLCSTPLPLVGAESQKTTVASAAQVLHHYQEPVSEWLRPYGLEALVNPDDLLKIHVGDKPRTKVALVIDVDFWAFGNIARQVSRYLSDRYEFIVIPIGVVSNINQVLMLARQCKLIHFFWREDARQIGTPYYYAYAQSLGFEDKDFDEHFLDGKIITTSVYDHLMLDEADVSLRQPMYEKLLGGYTVASEKLRDIYAALPNYPKPTLVTEDGVDLSLFRPMNMERLDTVGSRPIVVGWVGNSKWEATKEDFKGLHTLLKPALEELREEGLQVEAFFADRQVRFIPHHKMPEYYSQIDIYVCASKIEGTPNPVLEAMACGVPVISTDVGIVPQVFGPKQKAFMLPERSEQALKAKLRELLCNPSMLRELSDENLRSIQDWSWEAKARKFGNFFDSLLEGK